MESPRHRLVNCYRMSLREIVPQLPKVELHVHIEGAIQPETVLRLAKRNNIDLPADNVEGMREWFKFTDFYHFVEVYLTISKCIRSPEDVALIAEEFAREQARQNILYTEANYTAMTLFTYCGIPWDEQFDALQQGFAKVPETRVNLILDIVRQWTPDKGEQVAQWCIDAKGKGVCAIGLSGHEMEDPISKHTHSFAEAKKAGLKCSAHAGENKGAPSIREALEFAYPDRIGHGVRCVEDGALVRDLRDKQIHLEVSPTSNVCIGVFPDLASHTLPQLLDEGLSVSINSDDPPYFNTTLTDEWIKCAETFDLSGDILYSLCVGAADKSFLSDAEKQELKKQIQSGWITI